MSEDTGMRSRPTWGVVAVCGMALIIGACGGSGGNSGSGSTPTSPTTPPPGATNTLTIAIANNAVSPKNIIVPRGSQVTFTNNDNRAHDMESDPHPDHTDCPELAQVGFLNPGQTRQSGNLNIARVCGFHDHNQAEVTGLQGSITIQ
jgi:plastocyanin